MLAKLQATVRFLTPGIEFDKAHSKLLIAEWAVNRNLNDVSRILNQINDEKVKDETILQLAEDKSLLTECSRKKNLNIVFGFLDKIKDVQKKDWAILCLADNCENTDTFITGPPQNVRDDFYMCLYEKAASPFTKCHILCDSIPSHWKWRHLEPMTLKPSLEELRSFLLERMQLCEKHINDSAKENYGYQVYIQRYFNNLSHLTEKMRKIYFDLLAYDKMYELTNKEINKQYSSADIKERQLPNYAMILETGKYGSQKELDDFIVMIEKGFDTKIENLQHKRQQEQGIWFGLLYYPHYAALIRFTHSEDLQKRLIEKASNGLFLQTIIP
jgi:hypothetical protein